MHWLGKTVLLAVASVLSGYAFADDLAPSIARFKSYVIPPVEYPDSCCAAAIPLPFEL